jgi:hypothetical protein
MRSMLENIFRILADELKDLTLGTVKKSESMNESINGTLQRWVDKNES